MVSRPMSTKPRTAKRKWKQWCQASCTWTPTWSWLRCTRVCSVVSRPMSASQKIAVSASKESEWEVNVDAMLPLWWRNQCHAKFLARVLGWWRNHCRANFWQEFLVLQPSSLSNTARRNKTGNIKKEEEEKKFVCTRTLRSSFPTMCYCQPYLYQALINSVGLYRLP